MLIDILNPALVEIIKNKYPSRVSRLASTRVIITDIIEGNPTVDGAYSPQFPWILFTRKWEAKWKNLSNVSDSDVFTTHFTLTHETVHLLSFSLVKKSGDRVVSITSGIGKDIINRGKSRSSNRIFNEMITNFYTLDLLHSLLADNFSTNDGWMNYVVQNHQSQWTLLHPLTEALIRVTGEGVLREAYFEGDLKKLFRAINNGGIDALALFDAFENRNIMDVRRILKID